MATTVVAIRHSWVSNRPSTVTMYVRVIQREQQSVNWVTTVAVGNKGPTTGNNWSRIILNNCNKSTGQGSPNCVARPSQLACLWGPTVETAGKGTGQPGRIRHGRKAVTVQGKSNAVATAPTGPRLQTRSHTGKSQQCVGGWGCGRHPGSACWAPPVSHKGGITGTVA